jgi:hypothetical protein
MANVAAELKRYGSEIGDEAIMSAAACIPLDSLKAGEAPLISAYEDMPEEMMETLASEKYAEWITDVSQRNEFKPEMVVIRPGALIGSVLGTMASVGDSGSWPHRALYVAGILIALSGYLKATAVKLSREEGQITLVIYMLTSNDSSKPIQVASVFSALNVQLADYNLPAVTDSLLRVQLQNLIALGILRLDAAADTICLQDKVIEL